MFKWFFILLIIFIISWPFGRNYLPEAVTKSKFGVITEDILFPLNKRVDRLLGEEMKYKSSIIELDSQKFNNIVASINSSNKPAVVYFFKPENTTSRFILRAINDLAVDKNNADVIFFVAAFADDKKEYSILLNHFDSLGFRPIILNTTLQKVAEYAFIKNNIKFSDLPVVIFKSKLRDYEHISPDLDIKDRILFLLNDNKL